VEQYFQLYKKKILKKKYDIKNKSFLNFGDIEIVYVSSHLNYNIDNLEDKITNKLKNII